MRRARGPAKRRRRASMRKARKASIARKSTAALHAQLALRTRERDEALEQQAATAEILTALSRSKFDLQALLERLLEKAVRLCDAERGLIYRQNGDVYRFAASYGHSDEFLERVIKQNPIQLDRSSATGRAVVERRVVHIHDILADAEYHWGGDQRDDKGMHRTILAVPMLRGDAIIGVITIRRVQVQPFTDKQIELLTNFAAQAVIAIENARLMKDLHQRTADLTESLEYQTATGEILGVISKSPTQVQPVFDIIAASALRLCGAAWSAVMQFNGETIELVAINNLSDFGGAEVLRLSFPRRPSRTGATDRAISTKATIYIPDVLEVADYDHPDLVQNVRHRSVLSVPMLRDGQSVGAITVVSGEPNAFTERQMALLGTFADQAVIAIENVRLFEAEQQRTRELARSLDGLRTAQDRLIQTEKLASLGQLTAGIAHEIKNPLNFVNNFSALSTELIDELQETLAAVSVDDKTRADITELAGMLQGNLEKVLQHGKRADSIVKNMLLHSRQGSSEHQLVDVNALVEESLNLAYHGARAEKQGFNIALQRAFDPAAGKAELFPQEINRVLLNIISNGFYAATKRREEGNGGDHEPTVSAATKDLGESVEIRIRDNGTGIPPEVKEKMFNPFFTTKPAGEGTGLGLSISHDIIVKQHSGSIEVDSEPGEFTEIRIVLPRASASSR
jgi:two-component system, NtrC family, sensor kinase